MGETILQRRFSHYRESSPQPATRKRGGTVGERWGHGQYPEDAAPKCIFLTT